MKIMVAIACDGRGADGCGSKARRRTRRPTNKTGTHRDEADGSSTGGATYGGATTPRRRRATPARQPTPARGK